MKQKHPFFVTRRVVAEPCAATPAIARKVAIVPEHMKQRRPLFVALAVAAIVCAIWSAVFLTAPRTETLDARVHDVASQLKCPICQGESVADSPSELAQQMRSVIRQQLQSGKSEQEVIAYFESRYGQQIVWSPPWQGFTLLAWLVPITLLVGGTILLFFILRNWQNGAVSEVNAQGDAELSNGDEADLKRYEAQLKQELAAEDPIFALDRTEGS